jgi:hypothetical protein
MREPRRGLRWSRRRVALRARYAAYMNSPEWFTRRERWAEEWRNTHDGAEPSCAVCGGIWTVRHGNMHHRSYDRLTHEHSDDLVALCRPDHAALHALIESVPAWQRLPADQATDLIVARLRDRHLQQGVHR